MKYLLKIKLKPALFMMLAMLMTLIDINSAKAQSWPEISIMRHTIVREDGELAWFMIYPAKGNMGLNTGPLPGDPATKQLGPYKVPFNLDQPPIEGKYPLIVISHGSSASHMAYMDLATGLARNGYLVAFPVHVGDNWLDSRYSYTPRAYVNRPLEISAVIDEAYASPLWANYIDKEKGVGAIGHSIGGYTILALMGFDVDIGLISLHCDSADAAKDMQFCSTPAGKTLEYVGGGQWPHSYYDQRIRAGIAYDPVGVAFSGFNIPESQPRAQFVVYVPEHSTQLNPIYHLDNIRAKFNKGVNVRQVLGAGHYSFLGIFPENLGAIPPAQDPKGFDRSHYHPQMIMEAIAYFNQKLN